MCERRWRADSVSHFSAEAADCSTALQTVDVWFCCNSLCHSKSLLPCLLYYMLHILAWQPDSTLLHPLFWTVLGHCCLLPAGLTEGTSKYVLHPS